MIVVPVTHDLIHLATVDTARLRLSLLDEVAEERGVWPKRRMVDVAVQGLVHSEHELSHTASFPHAAHPRGSDWSCNRLFARSTDFISQLVFGVPLREQIDRAVRAWALVPLGSLEPDRHPRPDVRQP